MNLFDRFSRVAKSNLNNVLKTLEDPEKIMNQAVEDMQADLVKVRQSYAEITATQRRLLKQKEQADALAEDWYKRAQLALSKGEESLAKEALTRRQQQVEQVANLQDQIAVRHKLGTELSNTLPVYFPSSECRDRFHDHIYPWNPKVRNPFIPKFKLKFFWLDIKSTQNN